MLKMMLPSCNNRVVQHITEMSAAEDSHRA